MGAASQSDCHVGHEQAGRLRYWLDPTQAPNYGWGVIAPVVGFRLVAWTKTTLVYVCDRENIERKGIRFTGRCPSSPRESRMDLRRFLGFLSRRWYVIALAALLAGTAAWYAWQLLPPEYEATALLHVPTPPVGVDWFQYDHNHSDRMINYYVTLGESRSVQEELLSRLEVSTLPDYTVEPVPNSGLVEVTGSGSTPEAAATAANELADILISLDAGVPEALDSGLVPNLRLVEAAVAPEEPAGLGLPLLVALGAFVGLIVGFLLALVTENLDQKLYFVEDIATIAAAPVLTVVPRARGRRHSVLAPTDSPQGRAYRKLRAQFLTRSQEDQQDVLVVATAQPRHGGSTTVVNLAAVLGATGLRTLIVDCARNSSALLETLVAKDRQVTAVKRAFSAAASSRLSSPLDNVRLVATTAAAVPSVLTEVRGHVDTTIVDAGSMTDSMTVMEVAPLASAVVLVVRLGSITGPVLADARDQLRSLDVRLLGVVVTGSRGSDYGARGAAPTSGSSHAVVGNPQTSGAH